MSIDPPSPAPVLTRRRLLQATLLAGTALGAGNLLTGCGAGPAATAEGPGRHLVSVPDLDNVYWQSWKTGAAAAASALGITSEIESYRQAIEAQIGQFEKAELQGTTLALAFPQNAASSPKIIEAAAAAGITVATAFGIADWSTPLEPAFGNHFAAFFSPEEVEGSRLMAQSVFDAIGNRGDVIHINHIPGEVAGAKRSIGVQAAVDANPGIRLVAQQHGNESRVGTRPVIEALLTAHPDTAAVVCHNDDCAIAVLDVLRERGLTRVKVGGVDALDEFLDAMRTGPNAHATVAIHGAWLAGYAVVRAFDVARGVQFDPLERMLYQDAIVIDTPDAAAEYQRVIYRADSLPFDWAAMSRSLNPQGENTQIGLRPMDPAAWFAILGTPKPAGYELPAELQASLDAGGLDTLTTRYRQAVTSSPLAAVTAATSSGQTVLGLT